MKSYLKNVGVIVLSIMALTVFNSCSNDDDIPGRPTIKALEGVVTVIANESKDFTFTVTMPGGYKSHSFQAANGNLIDTPITISPGAKNASFTTNILSQNVGAAVISLTVTDRLNQTDTKSVTINVIESN